MQSDEVQFPKGVVYPLASNYPLALQSLRNFERMEKPEEPDHNKTSDGFCHSRFKKMNLFDFKEQSEVQIFEEESHEFNLFLDVEDTGVFLLSFSKYHDLDNIEIDQNRLASLLSQNAKNAHLNEN